MDKVLAKMFEEAFQGKNLKSLQNLENKMNFDDDGEDLLTEIENMCFKIGVKSALELLKVCEC